MWVFTETPRGYKTKTYRDLAGLVPYLDRRVLPRPRGSCRLTWTGVCVTETLWVLSPYLDRRVCCMRCCSNWSQGTGCRRAAGPGCRRRGSGTCCRFHRPDCRSPTLPRSPTHRSLKDNGVLSLPSSPIQQSALSVLYLLNHTCWHKPRHPQTPRTERGL